MAQFHDVICISSDEGEEKHEDLGEPVVGLSWMDSHTLQRKKKQSTKKSTANANNAKLDSDRDDDCEILDFDECMVLNGDPDKPREVAVVNDSVTGSDELVVVAEKGQIACRDYPHARHLCVTFPFSTSPHEKYCDLCHCYVCDAQAPCVNWGTGGSVSDHCHATEKDEVWRIQRQSSKQVKVAQIPVCIQSTKTPSNEPSMHPVVNPSSPVEAFQPRELRLNSSLSDVQGGRLTGTVKWFSDQKGYGFIIPNSGGEDLFVHSSSIKSEGIPDLIGGDKVEFQIETVDHGANKAVNVSGPGGSFIPGTNGRDDACSRSLQDERSKPIWRKLVWCKLVQPKHSFVMWQIMKGSIKTNDLLRDKGINVNPVCPLCESEDENIGHTWFDCSYSKIIWENILALLELEKVPLSSQWKWFSLIKQTRYADIWTQIRKSFIGAMVYFIWMERNQRLHKKSETPPQILLSRIIQDVKLFLSEKLKSIGASSAVRDKIEKLPLELISINSLVVECNWSLPTEFYLSTYASLKARHAGIAAIIRNNQREVVKAFSEVTCMHNILNLEVFAIESGMEMAQELNIQSLYIQSDSDIAVTIICHNDSCPWKLKKRIAHIRSMLNHNPLWSVHCGARGTNRLADFLAGRQSTEQGRIWYSPPFDEVFTKILKEDKQETIVSRR